MSTTNLQFDLLDIRSLYFDPPISIKDIDLKEQLNLFLGLICDEWEDIDFIQSLQIEYWKIEKNDDLIDLLDEDQLNYWLTIIETTVADLIVYIEQNYQSNCISIIDKDSKTTIYEYSYSSANHREHCQLLTYLRKLLIEIEVNLSILID